MVDAIPLAQMLASVTEELHKAQAAAQAKGEAMMQFAECELEFAIAAADEGKAGVKLYVINLSAGVKRTETNTIRVKFKSIPGHAVQVPQVSEGAPGPELKKQDATPR